MRRKHRRALASYVREVADRMGLIEYNLTILDIPPDGHEDALGWCKPTYGQHHATLWFADDLIDSGPAMQKYVVVHELGHIWLDPLDTVLESVKDLVGGGEMHLLRENWKAQVELTNDRICRSYARDLPNINWNADPSKRWIPDGRGPMLIQSRRMG
jgi:hypothetical protein